MQEDDLASLDWTGVLPRWKTHTVTDAWYCILPCARRDLRSRACARPCANEQATRPCNYREYGSYTLYTYLLLSLCYSQDAETTMLGIARTTRVRRELVIRIHRSSHECYSYARFIACLWKKNIFRITWNDEHTQTHKY